MEKKKVCFPAIKKTFKYQIKYTFVLVPVSKSFFTVHGYRENFFILIVFPAF